MGREVEDLLSGQQDVQAGRYTTQWDPDRLPSGRYIVKFESREYTKSQKGGCTVFCVNSILQANPELIRKLGRHIVVGYKKNKEINELIQSGGITGVFLSKRNVSRKTIEELKTSIHGSWQDYYWKSQGDPEDYQQIAFGVSLHY